MKLYKSNERNPFHYVTLVTFNRVPVFKSDQACQIFVDTLREVREKYPCKLIGYVIMPDHVHAIVNNRTDTISDWLRRVRGNSARKTLAWLRAEQHLISLKKLELIHPQKRQHTHAVRQKDPSVIDLWSHKFVRQKLNYLHLNPVRAGLCRHPQNGSGRAIVRTCRIELARFRLKSTGKHIGRRTSRRSARVRMSRPKAMAGSSPPLNGGLLFSFNEATK